MVIFNRRHALHTGQVFSTEVHYAASLLRHVAVSLLSSVATLTCRCANEALLCCRATTLAPLPIFPRSLARSLARRMHMPHAPAGGDYAGKRVGRRRVQGVGQCKERCGSSHWDKRRRCWRWRRHDRHRYRDRPDTVRTNMGSSVVALTVQRCLFSQFCSLATVECSEVFSVQRCLFPRVVTSFENSELLVLSAGLDRRPQVPIVVPAFRLTI